MFGVLPINKPAGLTSRDVVTRVARLIKPVKIGHTGTLDPLATGVLLLAVGPATRLTEFAHSARKSYRGTFELGKRSDTLDSEGEIETLADGQIPSHTSLVDELGNWVGCIRQRPPRFSAIHINGKRAYDLARAGESFEVPEREVQIHQLALCRFEFPILELDIQCGTGTYIRTLGSDIARALGNDAIMTKLERTAIGTISLDACCELDDLQDASDVLAQLQRPEVLLSEHPRIDLTWDQCQQIRNGIPLQIAELVEGDWTDAAQCAAFTPSQQLLAVLRREAECLRSLRVFHLDPAGT